MFIPMWLVVVFFLILFYPTFDRFFYVLRLERGWAITSLGISVSLGGASAAGFYFFFNTGHFWGVFGVAILCFLQPQIDRHFVQLLTQEIEQKIGGTRAVASDSF